MSTIAETAEGRGVVRTTRSGRRVRRPGRVYEPEDFVPEDDLTETESSGGESSGGEGGGSESGGSLRDFVVPDSGPDSSLGSDAFPDSLGSDSDVGSSGVGSGSDVE